MPYIKEFAGAVVVIKYGGAAMINETIKASVMEDIALIEACGNEAGYSSMAVGRRSTKCWTVLARNRSSAVGRAC